MNNTTLKAVDWSLAQVWNAVAMKPDRPLEKRNYVYASELGKPYYDRILKMNAVKFTTPPNDRSRRKFLAGNLFEYLVKQILISAGIYKRDEVKIDASPYPDTLDVHGRCDFSTVNGFIDQGEAVNNLAALALPEYLYEIGKKLIKSLEGVYLKEKILELKSVSTFAMDKVEKSKVAIPGHSLQAYHYQKNGKIPAEICYCCRDDMRMAEFGLDVRASEAIYRADLEKITYYYKKKKTPPREPLCLFDDTLGRFSKNFGIEYSVYLTHYGFKSPDEYRQAVSFIEKWNRALNRFVLAETGAKTPTGKPIIITSKNNDIKTEITKAGHDFKKIIALKIELGEIIEEEID